MERPTGTTPRLGVLQPRQPDPDRCSPRCHAAIAIRRSRRARAAVQMLNTAPLQTGSTT